MTFRLVIVVIAVPEFATLTTCAAEAVPNGESKVCAAGDNELKEVIPVPLSVTVFGVNGSALAILMYILLVRIVLPTKLCWFRF